jgi:hypothetical protein
MSMRWRANTMAATVLLLAAVLSAGGCGQACAGQCGPPYQLQVIFRPGTPQEAAVAALRRCAGDPLVARIGNVRWFRGPGEPPGSQTATIYTRAMPVGARHVHLLACLRRSPSVTQASWPD